VLWQLGCLLSELQREVWLLLRRLDALDCSRSEPVRLVAVLERRPVELEWKGSECAHRRSELHCGLSELSRRLSEVGCNLSELGWRLSELGCRLSILGRRL
jgi:hypothetical protein